MAGEKAREDAAMNARGDDYIRRVPRSFKPWQPGLPGPPGGLETYPWGRRTPVRWRDYITADPAVCYGAIPCSLHHPERALSPSGFRLHRSRNGLPPYLPGRPRYPDSGSETDKEWACSLSWGTHRRPSCVMLDHLATGWRVHEVRSHEKLSVRQR